MEELFLKARLYLSQQFDNVEPEDIRMDTPFDNLKDGIKADSINIFEMIMALEDDYDVEFPEDELENYPTIGDLIKVLWAYLESVGK